MQHPSKALPRISAESFQASRADRGRRQRAARSRGRSRPQDKRTEKSVGRRSSPAGAPGLWAVTAVANPTALLRHAFPRRARSTTGRTLRSLGEQVEAGALPPCPSRSRRSTRVLPSRCSGPIPVALSPIAPAEKEQEKPQEREKHAVQIARPPGEAEHTQQRHCDRREAGHTGQDGSNDAQLQ